MKAAILIAWAGALSAGAVQAGQTYGDTLVAQTLARHPDVLTLSLYATPPKASASVVIASSRLPAGQTTPDNAAAVQVTGQPTQVADGAAVATIVPLLDVAGEPIGALSATLPAADDAARPALLKQTEALRDELRRKVINVANLLDPYPYVQDAPNSPYAQRLVDQLMAAHPELLVLALHVRNANGSDYPIIASSIGRIGKKADHDDMQVVTTGEPLTGAYGPNKSRFGIELAMYDAAGSRIGAMSVGFHHHGADEEPALVQRARQIEAELRAQIPSLAQLLSAQ
ncbi:hypothetical protein [Duganella sp. Dugasp56]|uniref:hypothetical protein n=1 Tax=Duganella sp. Dugasp56 TaxID=3243046 RepID=UPI0039AEC901